MQVRKFSFRSLKFKIFISNLFIVLGMFLLFGAFLLKMNLDQERKTAMTAARASLSQTSTYLSEKTASIRNAVDSLALSQQTLDILNMDNTEKYKDIVRWNIDYNYITESVMKSMNNSDIAKLVILTENELAKIINTPLVFDISVLEGTPWHEKWYEAPESYIWHAASDLSLAAGHGEEQICFTRSLLYSYYNYQTLYIGYVDRKVFDNLLNVNTLDEYTSFFVMNNKGQILSGSKNLPAQYLEAIANRLAAEEGLEQDANQPQLRRFDNQELIVGSTGIPDTNLYLIYIHSLGNKIRDMIKSSAGNMAVIILLILPVVLGLSLGIAFSVTRRIDRLRENMLQAGEGDFGIEILQSSQGDEIGVLTKHFNYMLTKISLLLDSQYAFGKRIKELELKSLQAQINPHFLYNTLDLLKWKAVKHNDSEIQELVTALSNYYRKSLAKGRDIVTVMDEIEHISAYVYIQNKRFDDCISLSLEIPEEVKGCMIPRITLQPIVENAVLHGLLEKADPSGTILIRAEIEGELLEISIQDDGIGMEREKADKLLTEDSEGSITGSGYGLKNIDERIKITFGKNYGLRFTSAPGEGTTVIITIPARTDEET